MSSAIYCIGVDPGVMAGIALLRAEIPTGKVTVASLSQLPRNKRGAHIKAFKGLASAIVAMSEKAQGCQCWIAVEGQYLPGTAGIGQPNRAKAVTALSLANMRGVVHGIAMTLGIEIFDADGINPNTWRSALGIATIGRTEKERAANITNQVLSAVDARYGITLDAKHEHTGEAVLIATYAINWLRIGRVRP